MTNTLNRPAKLERGYGTFASRIEESLRFRFRTTNTAAPAAAIPRTLETEAANVTLVLGEEESTGFCDTKVADADIVGVLEATEEKAE